MSEQTLLIERDALRKTLLEDIKKKDSVEHKIATEFQELKKVEVLLEKLRLSGKPRV